MLAETLNPSLTLKDIPYLTNYVTLYQIYVYLTIEYS